MCFIEINRKFTSSNVKLSVAAENYKISYHMRRKEKGINLGKFMLKYRLKNLMILDILEGLKVECPVCI